MSVSANNENQKSNKDIDDGVIDFPLLEKWPTSPDSWVLRFALPSDVPVNWNNGDQNKNNSTLGPPAPSGVKLVLNHIEKSYSPVSHQDTLGYFDLLVKSYPYREGGGFGSFLCGLEPGRDSAPFKIKKPRVIHGMVGIKRRWLSLTMIAGGTGVAPFIQIIRSILSDDKDRTKLRLIFVNRHEEDILIKSDIDKLASAHPTRFAVTYFLTQPSPTWKQDQSHLCGRGTVEEARNLIPSPIEEEQQDVSSMEYEPSEIKRPGRARSMVMVCGRDGFVATWAGPLKRIPASPGMKKQKVQGPVRGILRELGYDEQQVYKF